MVLTVSFVLFPVIGLFVTVIGAVSCANLTPASGRQDHTTSPSASSALVRSAIRVHRIPPHVRDDRETPLRGGTARIIDVIWGKRETEYFFVGDWTTQITLNALAFFVLSRTP